MLLEQPDNFSFTAESSNPSVVLSSIGDEKKIEVPHAVDTTYLSHAYFRFIGKFPPQILAYLMNRHSLQGPLLDPMCGGGTSLVEALLRGIEATGLDVNPVSVLFSRVVSLPILPELAGTRVSAFLTTLRNSEMYEAPDSLFKLNVKRLKFCDQYFSDLTKSQVNKALEIAKQEENSAIREFLSAAILAVLRKVSRANIKKMNLEIDDEKSPPKALYPVLAKQLELMLLKNRQLYSATSDSRGITVSEGRADATGLPDGSFQTVVLHPPYLTNTAYSEFTQLQLAVLEIDHKDIWKRELRCRGSFLHEPNGLQKYLLNWNRILAESFRVLAHGGKMVVIVGDGQIDYTRIPVGAITEQFAGDIGFNVLEKMSHVLNNNTGRTQSRKMVGQHVLVFEKQ